MTPLRIRSGLNVEKETVLNNIEFSSLSHPWLDRQLGSGELCIVGGGPSLTNYIDRIRAMQERGVKVMALNNAHDYLISNGIKIDFAVMLDARKDNAAFYQNPQDGVVYLMASQVHEDVLKALEGYEVKIWHSSLGDEARDVYKRIARERKISHFPEIGGGCTVGLRACYLAYAIGFKDLNLYGYDSSHEEYHHAYKQELNDSQDVIEVEVKGRKFKTSPTMAKQAYQFQSVVMRLSQAGVELTVHGGGLLPTIHQEMHRPLSPDDLEGIEARKYSNMWAFDEYRHTAPGEEYVDLAIQEMGMAPESRIIDFGVGTGRGAQMFKDKGFDITGIDHAANCLDEDIEVPLVIANLWTLPDIHAKYGYCTDVMEHIPPQKVDAVLQGISERVEKCFFNIHTAQERLGELIDDVLHLSVHDSDWWKERLSAHFDSVREIEETYHGDSALLIGENNVKH